MESDASLVAFGLRYPVFGKVDPAVKRRAGLHLLFHSGDVLVRAPVVNDVVEKQVVTGPGRAYGLSAAAVAVAAAGAAITAVISAENGADASRQRQRNCSGQ